MLTFALAITRGRACPTDHPALNHHHPLQRSSPASRTHMQPICEYSAVKASWPQRNDFGQSKPGLRLGRAAGSQDLSSEEWWAERGIRSAVTDSVEWEWSSRVNDAEEVHTSRPSFLFRRPRACLERLHRCAIQAEKMLLGVCTNRATCADLLAQAQRSAHELQQRGVVLSSRRHTRSESFSRVVPSPWPALSTRPRSCETLWVEASHRCVCR